jgi:hypothetical protein
LFGDFCFDKEYQVFRKYSNLDAPSLVVSIVAFVCQSFDLVCGGVVSPFLIVGCILGLGNIIKYFFDYLSI